MEKEKFNFTSLDFKSEEFGKVRIYTDDIENVWFNLNDICNCLDIANPRNAAVRLNDNEKMSINTNTVHSMDGNTDSIQRGNPNMTYVSESGLYKVIFQSRKPNAAKFQDWVCGEVLPSIRKHGAYISKDIINDNRKLRETIKEMQEEYSANKEKIDFADSVLNSESSLYIAELASYLTKNHVKIGRNSLFKWLKDNRYIYMEGDKYIPCARYMKKGYFDLRMNVTTDAKGRRKTSTTLMTTSKGMGYFLSKLMKEKAPKVKVEVLSLFDAV